MNGKKIKVILNIIIFIMNVNLPFMKKINLIMKKLNYIERAFFIILFSFFISGLCQAQTPNELKSIEESGISAIEYNDILNTEVIGLPSTCGPLTLTLTKVYGTTNDPKMKHTFVQKNVQIKNNPNRPIWPAIPYNIIREEDYDENK